MTEAEVIEHRKRWRHMLQAAFAEQEARMELRRDPLDRKREARLVAEGTRLDAAIDALEDSLGAHEFTRPGEGPTV